MLSNHRYGATASNGFPAYAPPFAGTKLYCLVIGVNGCEQLAQSFCSRTINGSCDLLTASLMPTCCATMPVKNIKHNNTKQMHSYCYCETLLTTASYDVKSGLRSPPLSVTKAPLLPIVSLDTQAHSLTQLLLLKLAFSCDTLGSNSHIKAGS